MNWRRLSYSICVAAVITAISLVKIDRGGEFILLPGLITQVMFNAVLLAIPSGDDFYSLPGNAFVLFNVAFYTSIIFTTLWFITLIKDRRL